MAVDLEDKIGLGNLEVDIFRLGNLDRSFMVKVLGNLEKEYFESMVLQKTFHIYSEFFQRFNKLPTRNILEKQLINLGQPENKVTAYLDRIFDVESEINETEKDYIIAETIQFAKRSRMKNAILESLDLLEVNNFEEITSKVKEALLFNLDVNKGVDLYDVDERYLRLHESLMNRLVSGYSQLDDVLGGGWAKKELYCFLGPPGIGKSIFLPNIGVKALMNGYNVVHYSLEMSEDRYGMRYDAISSAISMSELTNKPDEIKKKYDIFKKATKARLKIKEFPTSMASILDIEAHLEQLKLYDNFEPDVLIIDYGDIMRSTRKTSGAYEEQGWIFRELRGLAVKYNVVIITATQSRRDALTADGGTKDILGMDQTADSMEKNRIIDALFSITQSRSDKDNGVINLWVAKNRNGKANQTLTFKINYSNMQIRETKLGISMGDEEEDETDVSEIYDDE